MYPLVPEEALLSAAQLALFVFTLVTVMASVLWGMRA
jgi:hypothetical protein